MANPEMQVAAADAAVGRMLRFGVVVATVGLVVDQLHKWYMIALNGILPGERFAVMPFLDIVYVINKGVSYGMFTQHTQSGQYLLAGFAMVVAAAMIVWLAKAVHTRLSALGIGLIIGGAVGNGIDRLHLGGVADFFQLHAYGFYWYVFNLADVWIVVGVVALLYDSFIPSRKDAAKQA